MGGRALKNTVTRRYLREEFDIISKELIDTLRLTFERVDMPLFYGKKESFGDADILVVENPDINMHEYLTKTFSPNEIFHNGSCWSFDHKELQVDVITSSAEHYDTSLMYFSYNDLGNYIGRLAHGFGLKYGQEGLWLEYQFKGSNVGTIPISKNYEKIFDFLGLSYERYKKGFDTLEEIFEYIAESVYFNWKAFQLTELNKINRDRNAKRASYMAFLTWIEQHASTPNHEYAVYDNKTLYYNEIDKFFPEANLTVGMRRLEYEVCRDLYIRAKFNGGMISRIYGFDGKELGEKISGFKSYVNVYTGEIDGYDEFILNTSTDAILKLFEYYLRK